MKRTRLPSSLLALLFLPLASLAIAVPGDANARRAYPMRIKPVERCKDVSRLVLDLAARQAVNTYYGYNFYYRGGIAVDATTAESGAAKGGATGHYTGTNNQEQGVDEADIVKSNGRTIFTIKGREVIVTSAVDKLRVVARFTLSENATPSQLQLYGDKLVVLSNVWQPVQDSKPRPFAGRMMRRPTPRFSGTRMSVYDVGEPSRPRRLSEVDIEGWMTRSRNVGDDIYLVTNSQLRVPAHLARLATMRVGMLPKLADNARHDWRKIEAARKAALPVVRNYLARRASTLTLAGAMPRMRRRIGNRWSALVPMYSCQQLTVPANQNPDHTGVLNVTHIDLDAPSVADTAAVVGSGWQVYASTSALYVTMANYQWNGGGNANSSQVHKFVLRTRRSDRPAYQASGIVPGHLLNQFSMSEHDGFLRLMTTDQQWGRQGRIETAGSNLFVMRPVGKTLKIVGQIRGLAEGERIYSARMFGDKGYMVTFRQTDPLFTFDLSNPYKPRMVGELKIDGFSSYIHPLDGDRLLTIGRDADKNGRVKGLHLQIFDVSDPATPVRTHHRLLTGGRWSYSAAQYDHHAFTYDAVTRTLAIPVSSYDGRSNTSALEVFDIGRRGIRYRGAITHASLPSTSSDSWRGSWDKTIARSMVIGNALISVSQAGIVSSRATHPSWTLSKVSFAPTPEVIGRKVIDGKPAGFTSFASNWLAK